MHQTDATLQKRQRKGDSGRHLRSPTCQWAFTLDWEWPALKSWIFNHWLNLLLLSPGCQYTWVTGKAAGTRWTELRPNNLISPRPPKREPADFAAPDGWLRACSDQRLAAFQRLSPSCALQLLPGIFKHKLVLSFALKPFFFLLLLFQGLAAAFSEANFFLLFFFLKFTGKKAQRKSVWYHWIPPIRN